MSISLLKSVSWGPKFEPEPRSNTVVLTGEKYFVDIRWKRGDIDLFALPPEEPPQSEEVEWAFAGYRTSEPYPQIHPGDPPDRTKCTWTHILTSRGSAADAVDTGLVCPHPAHPEGSNMFLETGSMLNPATGKIEEYSETWHDIPAERFYSFFRTSRVNRTWNPDDERQSTQTSHNRFFRAQNGVRSIITDPSTGGPIPFSVNGGRVTFIGQGVGWVRGHFVAWLAKHITTTIGPSEWKLDRICGPRDLVLLIFPGFVSSEATEVMVSEIFNNVPLVSPE